MYPLLSQERVKLRTANFIRTFVASIETKAINNFGKVAVGVARDSRGVSRGHLCDSTAFLLLFLLTVILQVQ